MNREGVSSSGGKPPVSPSPRRGHASPRLGALRLTRAGGSGAGEEGTEGSVRPHWTPRPQALRGCSRPHPAPDLKGSAPRSPRTAPDPRGLRPLAASRPPASGAGHTGGPTAGVLAPGSGPCGVLLRTRFPGRGERRLPHTLTPREEPQRSGPRSRIFKRELFLNKALDEKALPWGQAAPKGAESPGWDRMKPRGLSPRPLLSPQS